MADLPGAPPCADPAEDDSVRQALERANDSLKVAGEELSATLQLLEERTARMHACDAILHALLAEAEEIFIGVDAEGRIEAWSRGADQHFESSAEDALGRRLAEFLEGDNAGQVVAAVRAVLDEEVEAEEQVRVVQTEGAVFRIRRVCDGGRGLLVIDLAD